MSVAPLIQLMSRGKQNDILNENPQITFWRYRHMKYTDFALEHVNVTNGNGESSVALGPMSFDLPRSGDLVNDCFAVFRLPGLSNVISSTSTADLQAIGGYVCKTTNLSGVGTTLDIDASGNTITRATADLTGELGDDNTYLFLSTAGDRYVFKMAADLAVDGALATAVDSVTLNGVESSAAATGALIGELYEVDLAATDAMDMDSYWDANDRCIRTGESNTVAAQFGQTAGAAVSLNSQTFELIESAEQRQSYHIAASKASEQALTLPGPQPYWCDGVGQAILKEVKLRVGSQYVDTLYSDYLYMWDELSDKPGRSVNTEGYGRMCMKGSADQRKCWSQTTSTVYVPIPMFFMRTSGNALPLIALQFHGVQMVLTCDDPTKFVINHSDRAQQDGITGLFTNNNGMSTGTANIATVSGLSGQPFTTVVRGPVSTGGVDNDTVAKYGSFQLCTATSNTSLFDTKVVRKHCHVSLNVGYVYLNVTERNKFADASFEILIDQVQRNISTDITQPTFAAQSLTLNHMVQELIWACKRPAGTVIRQEPFNYSGEKDYVNGVARDPIKALQLRLNNSTRFNMNNGQDVDAEYFRTVEPYLHHSRVPDNHIYSYSFALNPESEQPSGAINMSRIDNAKLSLHMSDAIPFNGAAYKVKDTVGRSGADLTSSTYNKLELKLFARNWNVFRVTLGLGGTKWAA